jgi:hypothetical protein
MALMQLIPITKAYRKGYEGIRWDVDDWGVVKAVKVPATMDATKANRKYGEAYGVDWEYPPFPDGKMLMRGTGASNGPLPLYRVDRIPGMPASRYQGC